MSYTMLTHKDVVTRVPHTCVWCRRKFDKGIGMTFQSGLFDGDWYSSYSCETCNEITSMSRDDLEDGGWSEGYVAESLGRGQTPEELLYQMRVDKEKAKIVKSLLKDKQPLEIS